MCDRTRFALALRIKYCAIQIQLNSVRSFLGLSDLRYASIVSRGQYPKMDNCIKAVTISTCKCFLQSNAPTLCMLHIYVIGIYIYNINDLQLFLIKSVAL